MDSLAYDFNHLLTTQLDSQRNYFEGLLAEARREKQQECEGLEQKLKEANSDLERHKQKLGKKGKYNIHTCCLSALSCQE